MITESEVRALIADLFEEEALVIGRLVATYDIDDDLVWSLVRSLDVIRRRALSHIEQATPEVPLSPEPMTRPHPAVEDFLRRVHKDAPSTTS